MPSATGSYGRQAGRRAGGRAGRQAGRQNAGEFLIIKNRLQTKILDFLLDLTNEWHC